MSDNHKNKKNVEADSLIPLCPEERKKLVAQAAAFVFAHNFHPPLSLEELEEISQEMISTLNLSGKYHKWLMVIINNEVWRDTVAAIPRERRMLMLPQCLRNPGACHSPVDELGLICQGCGSCVIGGLEKEAEELGIMTLVAEGSSLVAGLLDSGQFDAVIGVSCLEALEKAFPYMVSHAIPGIAIPLTSAGCVSTSVDVEMIRQALYMTGHGDSSSINLEELRNQVKTWFAAEKLDELLGPASGSAEIVAREWLAGHGKRWRPFMAAAVYSALTGNTTPSLALRQVAVAVECFHKASLIHDDIEDDDDFRYGQAALHKSYNLPVALNAGDSLLGEGYRLLAMCSVPDAVRSEMFTVATNGHRNLCRGQGDELEWRRNPAVLKVSQVIDIFRGKTSPAFNVAIVLGALCAGVDAEICGHLKSFSDSLGIAYQIKDDLDDFQNENGSSDASALRLSVILAAACENSDGKLLIGKLKTCKSQEEVNAILAAEADIDKAIAKARQLFEHYRNQTVRALRPVTHSGLKRLLFRIAGRILQDDSKNKSSLN
jgi:geranylgeranyl pyrophosphate synthase